MPVSRPLVSLAAAHRISRRFSRLSMLSTKLHDVLSKHLPKPPKVVFARKLTIRALGFLPVSANVQQCQTFARATFLCSAVVLERHEVRFAWNSCARRSLTQCRHAEARARRMRVGVQILHRYFCVNACLWKLKFVSSSPNFSGLYKVITK